MPVQIKEKFLPIVTIPGVGTTVLIPTVESVRYNASTTLGEALAAMNGQILTSAATVADNETKVADMVAFLVENFAYVPKKHATGNTYLTPLFAELEKVPSDSTGGIV